ncbi:winged helix-turn-helix domain-containing protein [Conexibacter arvalis]|uniref:DNA-binding transcriptional ArsR family regulator n=1 Tax=Conexibacter arvalis TaxID=912552 RepID=A0A840IAW4_9ACTN|nr:winged helix-turn-helix domain-containing protein [Conexibacter arvalis]MBB4661218.1 DNA-binding transcriptional ArsR family regulator [Conexibacter arvalis]
MTELLLPRLKQEIEARLAELRPLIAEIEQLEAAKAALLAGADASAVARRPKPARRAAGAGGARSASAAGGGRAKRQPARDDGERAPRGANRDAILAIVEERPGVSVAEIASVTKIAKPTVATTVSKLKREGVLADEAGGVKLASRQALTLSGPAEVPATAEKAEKAEKPAKADKARKAKAEKGREAEPAKAETAEPPARDEGLSDAEWAEAAPASGDGDA